MNIRGWHIDGFGVFRDFEVSDLPVGLTVLIGPNEAGKSTLLGFLRGVLFGFPDGRSREPKYPQVRGGRQGGSIVLASRAGEHVLRRHVGERPAFSLTLPDGRPGSEAELHALVSGADDRLFRSVFAFSLTELQSLESLTADGVRDRIFSAGIAGAGRSARGAMRDLDSRTGALLRPRSPGRINQLWQELASLDERLERARQSTVDYLDWVREEEERAVDITSLSQEMEGLRARAAHLAMLIELWPTWSDLQAVQRQLDELEAVDDFPPEATERMDRLLREIHAVEQSLEELKAEQSARQDRLGTLQPDDAVATIAFDVEQASETLALYRSLLRQLPAVLATRDDARALVEERLGGLGQSWTADAVEKLDLSIPVQESVRGALDGRTHAAAELQHRRREVDAAAQRQRFAEEARDRITRAHGPLDPDADRLDEMLGVVRRLRGNLRNLQAEEAAADMQKPTIGEHERTIAALAERPTSGIPGWLAGFLVAALVATALLGGVLLAPSEVPWVVAVTLSVAAGATYLLWRRRRRSLRERGRLETEIADFEEARNEAILTRTAHLRRARTLEASVTADCDALGLPGRPGFQTVDDLDEQLLARRARSAEWKERQARLDDAVADLERVQAERRLATDALATARLAAAQHEQALEDWKARVGVPMALSAEGLVDFLEAARACREAIRAQRAAEAEAAQLSAQVEDWQRRARDVVQRAELAPAESDEQLVEQVLELRRRCGEVRQTRDTRAVVEDELLKTAAKVAGLQSRLRHAREAERTLQREAGATDADSFRRRWRSYQRRQELQTRFDDLARHVVGRVGRGPEAAAIRRELSDGRLEEWRTEAAGAETRVVELQHRRDAAVARHRDVQRARAELEASADIARFETEREGIAAELRSTMRQWRVLTLARRLIEQTLREFERTRQPNVLAQASNAFAFVTQGRYERIVQTPDTADVLVVERGQPPKPVDSLSRGTAEQLYFCIRLALATEFGRRGEALPLVMDDVFVNFDPERALAVAEVVSDFARSQQILVFTCHPSTRDLLLGVAPGARVIELNTRSA